MGISLKVIPGAKLEAERVQREDCHGTDCDPDKGMYLDSSFGEVVSRSGVLRRGTSVRRLPRRNRRCARSKSPNAPMFPSCCVRPSRCS